MAPQRTNWTNPDWNILKETGGNRSSFFKLIALGGKNAEKVWKKKVGLKVLTSKSICCYCLVPETNETTIKRHSWDSWGNMNMYSYQILLRNWLILLAIMLVQWLNGKCPRFLEMHNEYLGMKYHNVEDVF